MVAQFKPLRVYLSFDGPRLGSATDQALINDSVAAANDSLGPMVAKQRREEFNVGCAHGVSGALQWFFSHEPMGIVLEDDCLPTAAFIEIASRVLLQYANNDGIGAFCGTNFAPVPREGPPLIATKYYQLWGWATWRRALQGYSVHCPASVVKVRESHAYRDLGPVARRDWRRYFSVGMSPQPSTWDYQFVMHQWIRDRVALMPRVSLVNNIGFEGGAHFQGVAPDFYRGVDQRQADEFLEELRFHESLDYEYEPATEDWLGRNLYSPSMARRLRFKADSLRHRGHRKA